MSDLHLATPFERLIARIIDKVVITAPVFLWFIGRPDQKMTETIGGGILLVCVVLLNCLWDGQTVGKRMMKIKISSPTGGKLNIARYLLREFAFTIYPVYLLTQPLVRTAWFVWMMATIMLVLFYGRGLHDLVAKTVVVKAEAREKSDSPAS